MSAKERTLHAAGWPPDSCADASTANGRGHLCQVFEISSTALRLILGELSSCDSMSHVRILLGMLLKWAERKAVDCK